MANRPTPMETPFWILIEAKDFPFFVPFPILFRGADILPNSANPHPRLPTEMGSPEESPDAPRS